MKTARVRCWEYVWTPCDAGLRWRVVVWSLGRSSEGQSHRGFRCVWPGNVLLLRGSMSINADHASVTTDDLIHMLGNFILEMNAAPRVCLARLPPIRTERYAFPATGG